MSVGDIHLSWHVVLRGQLEESPCFVFWGGGDYYFVTGATSIRRRQLSRHTRNFSGYNMSQDKIVNVRRTLKNNAATSIQWE
jgi:hypothetical protein